jgi:DNA excision repair protein ERCC-2
VDFAHHHGRCVVVLGMPYQYTKAPALLQRLQYIRSVHNISQSDYLTFDAIRHAAQCAGRVIRSKSDYSVVVFADSRYNFPAKKGIFEFAYFSSSFSYCFFVDKLPHWIRQEIQTDFTSLSTDVSVTLVRRFVREMAQPWDLASKIGTELWAKPHLPDQPDTE